MDTQAPGGAKAVTEDRLHEQVAQFLDLALPDKAVWHHSPNEGKRGWKSQRAIKRMGVRRGWPDIEIIYQGRGYFIELKAPNRYLTKDQKLVHQRLRAAGATVTTCRSVEQVEAYLGLFMPLKAQVAA